MTVTRTRKVNWITAAGYTDLSSVLSPGIYQVIPKDGMIYINDGLLMSASTPYTLHGVPVPRECTDFFIEVSSEPSSVYLPANTSVCLRQIERA